MDESTGKIKTSTRAFITGIVGNLFEHYDSALYAFLAPFIAPLFFPFDPITSLILTYAIMPLGLLSKPLGALIFGYIGDVYGRKRSLYYSLLGMAITTCFIGLIPPYKTLGILSPILLALSRILQSFFAAGEGSGGAIYILEETHRKEKSFLSSLYDCSTILGILLASFFVMLLSSFDLVEKHYPLLFFFSGLAGVIGVFLRRNTPITFQKKSRVIPPLMRYRKEILAILLASGFSYTVYSFTTSFMNGFLPLISRISKNQSMSINTFILLFDLMLLPVFGYLAEKISKEKQMAFTALITALITPSLFFCLPDSTIFTATCVRFILMLLGISFAAPFHFWTLELIEPKYRFRIISFSYALGSQLIGSPSSAISLWMYQKTGWIYAPALYLSIFGLLSWKMILELSQSKKAVSA